MPPFSKDPTLNASKKIPWLRNFTIYIATTHFGRWLIPNVISKLDIWLAHRTNGKAGFAIFAGLPPLLLITRGARTGQTRETPLLYTTDGDKVIVIASKLGSERNPDWYHNLKTNPEAKLSFNGSQNVYLSREVFGEERQRYWNQMVRLFPGYAKYEKLAGSRHIPVILFTPTSQS